MQFQGGEDRFMAKLGVVLLFAQRMAVGRLLRLGVLCSILYLGSAAGAATPGLAPDSQDWVSNARGNYAETIERTLRYFPDEHDFVITNGHEYFNRPLYSANSAFRIDGGDKPEFSFYMPGRGGNLRFGLKTPSGVKWLNDAKQTIARYRPGSMLYEIRDPLLGDMDLHLAVLPLSKTKGLIARAELRGPEGVVSLIFAFGGANGMRGQRNGDIGCERRPVSEFFQLLPGQCIDNDFSIAGNTFLLNSSVGTIAGVAGAGTTFAMGDANLWPSPDQMLASLGGKPALAVVVGQCELRHDQPVFLALERISGEEKPDRAEGLPELFSAAEQHRRAVSERVQVETPDPFINAATAALNVAADAIWDDSQHAFMHGAVAWRTRLLGWRGPYAGDELGWHERTATHFAGFARQQNTKPVPENVPPADENVNLARNEAGLHSNGDLTRSHYDMNLVAVDAFFRHLLWTGDLDFARQMWPVIERHMAWERRLFRREFGADKLPLYEAYAAIWASDNLQYNGGGVTHASAYNYWHNKMAARVARLLGKDTAPYEGEAALILSAMRENLWLANEGWFAEFKDYLGLQRVHPSAGLWTFYFTLDSEVSTPFEAWQMTRFVDAQIAHIPVRGPGVPAGDLFTLPETSWMPYMWSINNVVMAEVAHTSLAYWQAGRPDTAFGAFKGCLLSSMYLGLCPGNVGAMTCYDMARGEAQRDFADGCGATSRALVEGLFGVRPDVLAGELQICPGFPSQWNHASIKHPDFAYEFRRAGLTETFAIEQHFSRPLALRLQIPALRDNVADVTVNGQAAKWRMAADCVGWPRIEIESAPALRHEVSILWSGRVPGGVSAPATVARGEAFEVKADTGELTAINDPQKALSRLALGKEGFRAQATGAPGQRTVFTRVVQGELSWWQPVGFEIRAEAELSAGRAVDWSKSLPATARFEQVDLTPVFNDKVTQIFHNEYLSPRSPFVSLAQPSQGIGGWCDYNIGNDVDDSGLRAEAARQGGMIRLPNGVPLRTPGETNAKNIVFTSQWDLYPHEASVPLDGTASRVFLLMAGSSNPMQSRFDNGEVIVIYADGTSTRLALHNPTTWWPIEQDYFLDDYAFRSDAPIPPRVDLRTGRIRILAPESFKGKGGKVPGGAATVLDLPLDPKRRLKSLTVRALANEVVIGLMAATLALESAP
jgi:hypothetical protein